jgi:hypothetical protein
MSKKKLGFGKTFPGFFSKRGGPTLNKFPTYWNCLTFGTGDKLA